MPQVYIEDVTAFYGKDTPLSNESKGKFQHAGYIFQTAESAFVYEKLRFLQADESVFQQLFENTANGSAAKQIGQQVRMTPQQEETWKKVAPVKMAKILEDKFTTNLDAKKALLATNQTVLVDVGSTDFVWGAGKLVNDLVFSQDPKLFPGKNQLGELLMQTRTNLRKKEFSQSIGEELREAHEKERHGVVSDEMVSHITGQLGTSNWEFFDFTKAKNDSVYTLALTGHRPKDFKVEGWGRGAQYNLKDLTYQRLYQELYSLAKDRLQEHGQIKIVSGMALGADTVWACVGANLKKEYPKQVQFEAHVPSPEQGGRWVKDSEKLWKTLLKKTDTVKLYGTKYSGPSQLQMRNEGMIASCDELVACYNGVSKQRSGTRNALESAWHKGVPVSYVHRDYFLESKPLPQGLDYGKPIYEDPEKGLVVEKESSGALDELLEQIKQEETEEMYL